MWFFIYCINDNGHLIMLGFFGEAHELMIEALNMFNQVYGPLHQDIVICYRAIARIHYLADDAVQAVSFQKKAVIVAERIYGIDHPEVLVSYVRIFSLFFLFLIFFLSWFFFHEHSRFIGQQGKGKFISLTPIYDFHPLHMHLYIKYTLSIHYLYIRCYPLARSAFRIKNKKI